MSTAPVLLSTLDDSLLTPDPAYTGPDHMPGHDRPVAGTLVLPGGGKAWLASWTNTRPGEGYAGKRSDTAAIVGLAPVAVNPPAALKASFNAMAKALEPLRGLKGGTTATAAWYDPKAQTLDLLSCGDSPSFIVFHDGNESVTVRVTTLNPDLCGFSGKDTYYPFSLTYASRIDAEGEYALGMEECRGTIHLEQMKKEVCEQFGLDAAKTDMTLLMTSDGMDEATQTGWVPGTMAHQNNLPAILRHAMQQENVNPASMMVKNGVLDTLALPRNVPPKHDDCTAIVLPLNARSAGPCNGPVAVIVADGMQRDGKRCSQQAVSAFISNMQNLAATPGMEAEVKPPVPHREEERRSR